ncbi:hypothetical protein [Actinacidiphila yeochonensis]|uniref:hypothetical protein n=1 Tax=Actinacidiphila yeochonensis TaxID=89050 RepID=UPI00055D4A3A|nr:hypothetical protein [Actinacidiphila yeochonensis]
MRGGAGGQGAAAVVLLAAGAIGCGGGTGHLVVAGRPPAVPYGGPLHVPRRDTAGRDDPASAKAAAGAAGLALECSGEVYSGGTRDPWSKGDGGRTPEEGLKAYFSVEQPDLPRYGYRVERRDAQRVLFSFDVGGRTKVAVIVARDQPGRPGWGPETSASCDPAELPASFTGKEPYEIWSDRAGHRVPVAKVNSTAGPAHCGWQQAHFLELDEAAADRLYARDPEGVLPPGTLTSRYEGDATLPADARDTGYHWHDEELWTSADTSKVYVRTSDRVEAWPAVAPDHACQ